MVLGADGVDQLFVSKAELKAQKAAAKAAKKAEKEKTKVFCFFQRAHCASQAAPWDRSGS